MHRIIVICVLLLFFYFQSLSKDTLLANEEFLFEVDCKFTDFTIQQRDFPVFAVAHDSIIVFPVYHDTLFYFNLKGEVIKKVYLSLNQFPTHLVYDNNENVLLFMNILKEYLVHKIDEIGIVTSAIKLKSKKIDDWFSLSKPKNTLDINKVKKRYKSSLFGDSEYNYFSPNILNDVSTIINHRYIMLGKSFKSSFASHKYIVLSDKSTQNQSFYEVFDLYSNNSKILKQIQINDKLSRSKVNMNNCPSDVYRETKRQTRGYYGLENSFGYIKVIDNNNRFTFFLGTIISNDGP